MKNQMKKLLMILLLLTLIGAVAVGLIWHATNYVMVDLKFYPRNSAVLDMRQEELTLEDYEKLRGKLPGTDILWMVPFQGSRYDRETTELTVETLSQADVQAMEYLTRLETVHADNCKDYEILQRLQESRPNVKVDYFVTVGGMPYGPETTQMEVDSVTEEELADLQYLTRLEKVLVTGCKDVGQLTKLRDVCQTRGIAFDVTIGGQVWPEDTQELVVTGAGDEVLELLSFLPELKKIHLVNPTADAAALYKLQQERTDLEITWAMEFDGQTLNWDVTTVDLTQSTVTDLAQVEAMMEYFPKAEKLSLGRFSTPAEGKGDYEQWESPITNQDVADYRERVRDKYKVAWEVQVGRLLTARTDDTTFRPDSHGVGRLFNDEVYNLRYCEDMICIDVGHMSFSDLSWAAYMPHLKYLIIAWTGVYDLTPLSGLKELVYLEIDWSPIKDYSPLKGCTALEDLNLGSTYAPIEPICEMTWLKNVWMVFCGGGKAWKVTQAIPDARVVASGSATVAGGWRRLPNYYAQRDLLNMYYMN